MGIIYKVTCIVTQKVYVGQTIRKFRERIAGHFSLKGCKHLHSALMKYGREAFIWEILEEQEFPEALNEAEARWIKFYDSTNPERGYNLTEGGTRAATRKWTEEQKQKQSEDSRRRIAAMTPEQRLIFGSQRGVEKSEETKQKMSESHKGVPFTEERRKALSKAWESRSREVSEETRQKIGAASKGRTHEVSEETRQKISKANKGRIPEFSEETRQKISTSNRGKIRSEEAREHYRQAMKAAWAKHKQKE